MPNRATYPTGNAFLVETPKSDRFLNQLYVEQQQRDALRQREDADLDKLLQAEIGKTRSVDQPEIINQYQQYKALKKQLLSDRKLKRDPIAYNQLKSQADRLQQGIMQTGTASAEQNERVKQLFAARRSNPDAFSDDFAQRLAAIQNTPVSIMDKHPIYGDLKNDDGLMYKGTNTDFRTILKDAYGTEKAVSWTEEPIGKEGFQTKRTPLLMGNNPLQVKDSLLGAITKRSVGRDAAALYGAIPQDQKEAIVKNFFALPPEKLKMLGINDPRQLLPQNPENKAEGWASLKAMEHAIDWQPKYGEPEVRRNEEAIWNAKKIEDRAMLALREKSQKRLMQTRKEISAKPPAEQQAIVDKTFEGIKKDALETGQARMIDRRGKMLDTYQMEVLPAYQSLFSRRNGAHIEDPDELRMTTDGDVLSLYFEKDYDSKDNYIGFKKAADGKPEIDWNKSRVTKAPQFKLGLASKLLSKKDAADEMGEFYEEDEGPSTNPSDWTQEGKYWKDKTTGKLYDDAGNVVKKK